VLGERWTLLVVRELLLGPKRFTDLRAGLPQIGPDVLSQRLRELEAAGLLQRTRLPAPAAASVYELTERGGELEPVILALGRWGSAEPIASDDDAFGVDSAMLALKTLFSPERAGRLHGEYELRFGDQRFRAVLAGGRFTLHRGAAESPAAVIETDPMTLAALLWRGLRPERAEADGTLALSGRRRDARRFLGLFPQ
jgi:DNA-binding HxlR family transcriptional regulator